MNKNGPLGVCLAGLEATKHSPEGLSRMFTYFIEKSLSLQEIYNGILSQKLMIVDWWLAWGIRMDNLYWIKPMKILQKKYSWVCSSLSAVFTNKKISSITSWWQDWMEICLYCIIQMLHHNDWECYNEVRLLSRPNPQYSMWRDFPILVRTVDFFIRFLRIYI